MDLIVTTSEETISVVWSHPTEGDAVTGYLVYYHHPNHNVTIFRTSNDLTELTTTQRVYTVSIQALSEHLPSIVVGPVTARGKFVFVVLYICLHNSFSPWPSTRFSGGECDGEETEHLMGRTSRAK